MLNPVVSVIIPCRNYGRYLREALDSVLDQSLGDLEVLLFNDDSTDETDQVARSFSRDRRVKYVHQTRQGLARTRNFGLTQATGRYIQFLDADDVLLPEKLATQSQHLDRDVEAAATYAPHLTIDASRRTIEEPIPWRQISEVDPVRDLVTRWDRDLHIPPVCFLFRREHLGGIRFDPALPTHEEWHFYLQLLIQGGQFRATVEPLALYRRHAGSLSTDSARMEAGRRQVLEEVTRWGGRAAEYASQQLRAMCV